MPPPPLPEAVLFTNIHLIPMTKQVVLEDQAVLVRGSKIAAIGPARDIRVPEGAVVIDGTGAYLLPGLADMHMHTRQDWLSAAWPVSPFDLYLANGVTTIRDFGPKGRPPTYALRWRDEIARGERRGPMLYVAGRIDGPIEDAAGLVKTWAGQGFDFIKLYSFLSKTEFRQAMTAAKRLDMYTSGHIPFAVGLDGVVSEGMDEIAHIEELDFEFLDFDRNKTLQGREWFEYIVRTTAEEFGSGPDVAIDEIVETNRDRMAAVVDKLRTKGIPICTTLFLSDLLVQKLFEPERFLARSDIRFLPQGYVRSFRNGREKHQIQFRGNAGVAKLKYTLERALLVELKHAGVRLLLSSDAGTGSMGIVPGFSIHDELRLLVEGGLTPYEAITAGTSEASEIVAAMTGTDDFGTIEVGKRGDLLLVSENPLEDVANLRHIRGVMANGRWYPKYALDRMLARAK